MTLLLILILWVWPMVVCLAVDAYTEGTNDIDYLTSTMPVLNLIKLYRIYRNHE